MATAPVSEARAHVLAFLRNAQEQAERGSEDDAEFLREAHECTAAPVAEDLTLFERAFVREFVQCRDASLAVRRAGSKANHASSISIGHKLRQKPRVKAAIEAFDRRLDEEAKVSRTEITRALKSNARKAAAAEQFGASNAAWIALGKDLHGMFGDRLDVRVLAELQDLLDMVEAFMKPESYADLVHAIAKAQGDEAVAGAEVPEDHSEVH